MPKDGDMKIRLARIEQMLKLNFADEEEPVASTSQSATSQLNLSESHFIPVGPQSNISMTDGPYENGLNRGAYESHSANHLSPQIRQAVCHVSLSGIVNPSQIAHMIQVQSHSSEEDEFRLTESLRTLMTHRGVLPRKLYKALRDVPTEDECHQLVEIYFTDNNVARNPIIELDFRSSYKCLMAHHGGDGEIDLPDVQFLPLFFGVLGTSMRMSPDWFQDSIEERSLATWKYYTACG